MKNKTTYKYKILEGYDLINEKQLNEFAKDGWKLITIIKKNDEYYFYLEKKIEITLIKEAI